MHESFKASPENEFINYSLSNFPQVGLVFPYEKNTGIQFQGHWPKGGFQSERQIKLWLFHENCFVIFFLIRFYTFTYFDFIEFFLIQ